MNRALIAAVALTGVATLAGCGVIRVSSAPWSTGGSSAVRHQPKGPACAGCIGPPGGVKGAMVLSGTGALTRNRRDSYVAYGVAFISARERNVAIPVPLGGTVTDLHVQITTGPRAGAGWTLTAVRNGTHTALSCAIAGAATSCSDASRISVIAGDTIDLDVAPFGRPRLAGIRWSARLTR